ncbi:MAG: rhodanese-like domain-containing protein [Defluviitaleaceae bacterium]|nr:rhodanese-like domain-containing protein [Defluviitaleaceae bacterium]
MAHEAITTEEAMTLMRRGALLIDVRTRDEFEEAHIPGALNLPLYEMLDGVQTAATKPDQTIIIYCETGRRSRSAAQALTYIGYTDVRVWQEFM